jgi:Phage integrase family
MRPSWPERDQTALAPLSVEQSRLRPSSLCVLRASGCRTVANTFRHSAASIVNEQTGNLKLAQKFLGHSTIQMTADIYTHTSAEAEREAAEALERTICAGNNPFPICSQFAKSGTDLVASQLSVLSR